LLIAVPILWWGFVGICLKENYVLDFSQPTMTYLLSWMSAFVYLNFTEGQSKRRVKRMLSQYVSEEMLNEVLAQPDEILHAGVGQEVNLSVLFSDVRSFTNISESLPAEQVVKLLNCHFSVMSEVIFANKGTLDKFIGDAIMAFWGAPIKVENHADLSVKAAIEMHQQIAVVNERLNTMELPSINVGIGINTGKVVLGNIGSDRKLDYTVIGDPVNLASRMEGITKTYGVPIIISESTRAQLTDHRPCVLLDRVRVKGKVHPIAIYLPLATSNENPSDFTENKDIAERSIKAFHYYQSQQWDSAIEAYQELPYLELRQLYIERIAYFKANPPPNDWDGVYTFETK
jgi:adenylate cyclase